MPSQTSSSSQGFPQISAPLTSPGTGVVTPPWYNFFANLWTRSGISQGGILVPSGQTVFFAGPSSNIPDGWLLCNGTALSQDTYPSLFAAIGKTWGGVGNLTFNLPDFRGKILIGANNLYPVGSSGALGHVGSNNASLPPYASVNYMIKT